MIAPVLAACAWSVDSRSPDVRATLHTAKDMGRALWRTSPDRARTRRGASRCGRRASRWPRFRRRRAPRPRRSDSGSGNGNAGGRSRRARAGRRAAPRPGVARGGRGEVGWAAQPRTRRSRRREGVAGGGAVGVGGTTRHPGGEAGTVVRPSQPLGAVLRQRRDVHAGHLTDPRDGLARGQRVGDEGVPRLIEPPDPDARPRERALPGALEAREGRGVAPAVPQHVVAVREPWPTARARRQFAFQCFRSPV